MQSAYSTAPADWASKNLDDQARLDKPKTVASETVLQAIEANLASKHKESIMQARHHNLGKSIQSCQNVPHITKILQNFWLDLV